MDPLEKLKKAHAAGVILGLKDVAGTVARKDIDVLLNEDPEVFNLFLLALSAIQDPSMTKDKMGYFEIAGIHGMPKRSWDGVEGKNLSYDKDSGYCAHSMETFPTWHRPYIAMMEQSLYLMILEIASNSEVKFPGIIANGLTIYPFDYSCPKVFTTPSLMVRMYPTNELVKLDPNPLHHYNFEAGIMGDDWEKLKIPEHLFPRTHTVRYPRPNPKWGDSVIIMNSVLNALRMDANRLVLSMMDANVYGDYDVFATNRLHAPPPTQSKEVTATETGKAIWSWPSGSLEAIHGLYHGLIGGDGLSNPKQMNVGAGGGHMSRVATAAFDPIFWFHHCEIDRFFAIWQSVHGKSSKSWFSNPEQAELPLLPSRKSQGDAVENFWTSNDTRNAEDFGYVYPDLLGTSEEVYSRFRRMYEWSVPLNGNTHPGGSVPPEMVPIDVTKSQFFKFDGDIKAQAAHTLLSETTALTDIPELQKRVVAPKTQVPLSTKTGFSREWYIDDQVERLALDGAFTIFYFIQSDEVGGVPDPSTDYALAPTLAAINHIFAAPTDLCDNCGRQSEQGLVIRNTSAITSMLLDFIEIGELRDLEAASVLPFLKDRLKWRIVTVNGELEDPRNLSKHKRFRINISCKVSRLPRGSDEVDYEVYPEIVRDIVSRASATAST